MKKMKASFLAPLMLLAAGISLPSCAQNQSNTTPATHSGNIDKSLVYDGKPIEKSDAEWKEELEPFQYYVMREQGTERAFSGPLNNNKKDGIYYCSACGLALFDATTKFDSGTGWPSFYQPIAAENVGEDTDYDIGYPRTEVHCARCGGHLGHVFNDAIGQPTGLRYCINSVSLTFEKR